MNPSPSRRALLASSAGLTTTLLAGCLISGEDGSTQQTITRTTGTERIPRDTPVSGIEVTGTELAISLKEQSGVSELNVIAPDGTLFSHNSVVAGERTVRVPIIETYSESLGRDNYTPGDHTVVAITSETVHQIPLRLAPALEVVDARLTFDNETQRPTGNIALDIENRGTASNWVYQIAYDGAPGSRSNRKLHGKPRWVDLTSPRPDTEAILSPGDVKTFIGDYPPLTLPEDQEDVCDSWIVDFKMAIGTGLSPPLVYQVSVTTGGTAEPSWNAQLCTAAEFELERIQEGVWD